MTQDIAQQSINAALRDPRLIEAGLALHENRLHDAEPILKSYLKVDPFNVAAIRMLAELAGRIGRYQDAENLLRRAVELAPNFVAARSNLAMVHHRQGRSADALLELDKIAVMGAEDEINPSLKAAILGRVGDYDEAVDIYQQLLGIDPAQPKVWMSFGHILKTVGRQADSIAAYRSAISYAPGLGEVWWSLANLKTVRFDAADIAAMEAALDRDDLLNEDVFHLHFALGKAYEEQKLAEPAFGHYARGNELRRALLPYDANDTAKQVDRSKTLYTTEFFERHSKGGCPAGDPVFILGMPRAGSTLIEQILASHSMIEGTMELPDIPALVTQAKGQSGAIARLSDGALHDFGQAYLERTRALRKTGEPYFVDKLPNNWLHIGFIRLILPNAKIIDARRHPLDCCFSNFKQHFARGQPFSYGLSDMGRYYSNYVELMAHFDRVLPGHIHRVIHERLIDDTEAEVRALLDYLGLPFEDACLRFYENDRAVKTASSEQVRRPINRDGVGQWKMFEQWLTPLQEALGPIVSDYPNVPVVFLS